MWKIVTKNNKPSSEALGIGYHLTRDQSVGDVMYIDYNGQS